MDLLTTNGFTKDRTYGEWLNIIMESAPCEWVMFHDHDIFLVNPNWFQIVLDNIKKAPEAGLLTCVTNRAGSHEQVIAEGRGIEENIFKHWEVAMQVQHNDSPVEATRSVSGLVMVTNKTAWKAAGGFKTVGIIGLDTNYYGRIKRAGFKVYVMTNLYVYHKYRVWHPLLGTDSLKAWMHDKRNPDYVGDEKRKKFIEEVREEKLRKKELLAKLKKTQSG